MNKYIVVRLLCLLLSLFSFAQAMLGRGKRPIDQLSKSKDHVKKICLEQCAICLEEQEEEEETPRLEALLCGHTFHAQCLDAYIKNAFGSNDTNFDQLRCPHFSSHHSSCEGVLTRAQIAIFTSFSSSSSFISSSSASSAAGDNAAILAFFDKRAAERATPPVINFTPADAAELAAIAAGHLQICPGCNSRANRIDGCNRMTCRTDCGGCGINYCYPCGTRYNPAINGGVGWEARACVCPHFPGGQPEPIPLADGLGGALPQANPMALINAAWNGDLEVVLALVHEGANLNTQGERGWTALHQAAHQGHLAVAQALIDGGADLNTPDDEGMTAFHIAASRGHLEVVQALIDAGPNLNRPDAQGMTALHIAGIRGHLGVVSALITAGADLNTQDPDGRTALHLAAHQGHLAVVQALLAAGADVKRQNADGWTALHYAASRGRAELVQPLIDAGADLNNQSARGWTALHIAAMRGYLKLVQALLDVPSIEINKQNVNGYTALRYAQGSDHTQVVQALIAAGANA